MWAVLVEVIGEEEVIDDGLPYYVAEEELE
jgi:hypothetical protein